MLLACFDISSGMKCIIWWNSFSYNKSKGRSKGSKSSQLQLWLLLLVSHNSKFTIYYMWHLYHFNCKIWHIVYRHKMNTVLFNAFSSIFWISRSKQIWLCNVHVWFVSTARWWKLCNPEAGVWGYRDGDAGPHLWGLQCLYICLWTDRSGQKLHNDGQEWARTNGNYSSGWTMRFPSCMLHWSGIPGNLKVPDPHFHFRRF